MKNKIYKIALVLSAFIFTLACENSDDANGDSVASPSNPSLSVSLGFSANQSLVETEADYPFTVTLSEAQVADVVIYLELLSNSTATDGDDLSFPHSIRIPAGSTSVSDVITIHGDDLVEETETATIKIGTGVESNVSATNSETVSFSIMNFTDGDVAIDMTWSSSTDFTDNLGNAIDDEAIADLILYVTDPNIPTSINYVTVDNAAGFESFVFLESFPDGEFYLVGEFYSAEDFGGNTADLDVSLTFNQPGVINDHVVTIPGALNTGNVSCQSTVLAKLTKAGSSYSIEPVGLPNNLGIPADGTFAGDYTVATTTAGLFGPQFDGAVTIVDNGDGTRSFDGDWNGFGVVVTYGFGFDATCGTVTFDGEYYTGLACPSGPGIYHGPSANAGTISDPTDDSVFSVTFTENTRSDCGGVPTDVTVTFTKNP